MPFEYPQVGFHFIVIFEIIPPLPFPNDVQFQEVSGLSVEMEMETRAEGGEHRFVHQLPVRAKYGDVTLKRGKFLGSGVLQWARRALEDFEFKPVNVMISMLNEQHIPLYNWYLVNAVPKQMEISGINAGNNEILVESMTLTYQYWKYFDPVSIGLDLAGGISGSAGVNLSI